MAYVTPDAESAGRSGGGAGAGEGEGAGEGALTTNQAEEEECDVPPAELTPEEVLLVNAWLMHDPQLVNDSFVLGRICALFGAERRTMADGGGLAGTYHERALERDATVACGQESCTKNHGNDFVSVNLSSF